MCLRELCVKGLEIGIVLMAGGSIGDVLEMWGIVGARAPGKDGGPC